MTATEKAKQLEEDAKELGYTVDQIKAMAKEADVSAPELVRVIRVYRDIRLQKKRSHT